MSSSYFGNVAAAAAVAATGAGWGATTATSMPHHHHHHQEQFYLHQNCAKYGYSEAQYYGHAQYQHHHHHQAAPAATTPSPPFRYASHGYPQPATMSFQCSTTLAPVKQQSLESSCTSPAASSSSSSSPSSSPDQHDQLPPTGNLYGFAQHQLDSFQQQVHHRHSSEVAAVQQHHQQSSSGPMTAASLDPAVAGPYDLHHRGFQTNLQQQQQQQQHHHHQSGPYCIKNTNASSYFPGWMQAYAGN